MNRSNLEKISKGKKEWEEKQLKNLLKKAPERKSVFKNSSGIEVGRVYTPLEIQGFDYLTKLGFPGSYPYTRGPYATMYRGRLWTMRQYAGFGTAEETNKHFKYLLSQGQTGLSVAFDLPTQIGYDSDHPLARGEVGRVGVAVDSLKDMEILFQGIPLDKVSTSMTINAPANVLLAMYLTLGEMQGINRSLLRGTVQNDILKEYIARGTYIFPPTPSLKIAVDVFEFCSKEMPKWNFISVSGYHMREAGANAVQELAFTLADGLAYINAALERGLKIDDFAPRISFFFACHNNFFEEIAKFRAARRLWAEILKEKYSPKKERSLLMRFHTQTSGCTLTAQQPMNNIIRVAYQALAAVLGGTQSLHTNSMDEALCLPSKQSVKIALRTQQILAYETGVSDTIDPLGGSYYLEWLTDELEEKARKYIDEIEEMGGMAKAIEKGFIQKEILETAYHYQKEIEKGETVVVGVNKFKEEREEIKIEIFNVSKLEETAKMQIKKLQIVKRERNKSKVEEALCKLGKAAEKNENLVPPIIEAVKAYATLGEICGVLRNIYGEYRAPNIL